MFHDNSDLWPIIFSHLAINGSISIWHGNFSSLFSLWAEGSSAELAQEARVPPTHIYASQCMLLTDGQSPRQMWVCRSAVNQDQRFFLWNLCPEVTCSGMHRKCKIYWLKPALGFIKPLRQRRRTFLILTETVNRGEALYHNLLSSESEISKRESCCYTQPCAGFCVDIGSQLLWIKTKKHNCWTL